ncbi:MAG: hypothetical protein WB821_01560 [Burkholderiaceae bacterium]
MRHKRYVRLHPPLGQVKADASLYNYPVLQRLALPVLVILCVIVACST